MNTEHHHDGHFHGDLAEMLDLDAEVFASATRAVHADIALAADGEVRSILDLGAGTGTGTFALLQHFTKAQAVAIDASADMLEHLERRAEHLGLGDRVTALQADLDEGLPSMATVDLAWASASLHHMADPDRTLADVAAVVRPGGLLAVAELNGFPRFLPDGTPGADAERRVHDLLAADRAADMPAMGSDWGSRLIRAGLTIEQHRTITADLATVPADVLGRYATAAFSRIHGAIADRLTPADRQAFDDLVGQGADAVRYRDDLHVSAERWLWIARRPLA